MPFRHQLLAFAILAMPWAACVRGDEPARDAQAADAQRIGQLIRRLGDDQFDKRESASGSLERMGVPALEALRRAAAANPDIEIRQRAADLVGQIENSLDGLLAAYRSFGLPLPPEWAPFVRYESYPGGTGWTRHGDGKEEVFTNPPSYAMAFLIEAPTKGRQAKVLHGMKRWTYDAPAIRSVIDPQRLTIKDIEANLPGHSMSLAFILQMHARGWPAAKTLFNKGFRRNVEHTPRKALRFQAWDYWDQRLTDREDDCWPEACRQMKALLADERELGTPENRSILKSLEAALVPSEAKPGSVDALIDDLINCHNVHDANEVHAANDFLSDKRFTRVFELGFEAVPALLEHLADVRLTRYREPEFGFNNYWEPAYHFRVRDLASEVLRMLSCETHVRITPKERGDPAIEKRLRSWWEEARKQDEQAYLLSHVLRPNSVYPDVGMAHLLAKKYPRRLSRLYREVLENRPNVHSSVLAEAIGSSSLPHDAKVELFVLAAKHKNLENRCAALWELKNLETERFVTLLIATLDQFPQTPSGSPPYWCETSFATLVCHTDDPLAWRALIRAAQRADPSLRMELLGSMYHPHHPIPTATQRQRRLFFLAAFLEDATMRDATQDKLDGIYAGFRFRRMEVRNFAAVRISELIGKPADPTPEWTAEQWGKFRDRMGAAAKHELAESPKD